MNKQVWLKKVVQTTNQMSVSIYQRTLSSIKSCQHPNISCYSWLIDSSNNCTIENESQISVFFKTFSCFKWCRIFMVQEVSHQPLIMEASVQSLARPCERCGEIVEQVQVFFDYFSVSLSVSFHECSWTHLSLMLIILPKHSAIKAHTGAAWNTELNET